MLLAEVLEVFYYFVVCKDEEAEASVLVSLPVQFRSDCPFQTLDLLLIVVLLVNQDATAAATEAAADSNLRTNSIRLSILVLHKF